MKFVIFCQSILSCWNHGNVHFLRGIARELIHLGHEVRICEPADGWSRTNLIRDHGAAPLAEAARIVPGIEILEYEAGRPALDRALDDADVVLVHEWTDPHIVQEIGKRRAAGGGFLLLFHDTHHRAITSPDEISRFDLGAYDGVLAFGEVLRQIYESHGWGRSAFTWHEAADWPLFHPQASEKTTDLVWIGNWGDDERDRELQEFLIEPAVRLGLKTRIFGVRYPEDVRARLRAAGIAYESWLPNHKVPRAFAKARLTVHIPRRPYVEALRGIPTIRMFEALACGIPLVSAPWDDCEGLFPVGTYVKTANGAEMTSALSLLMRDQAMADELSWAGAQAIKDRHTCGHRVQELLKILAALERPARRENFSLTSPREAAAA